MTDINTEDVQPQENEQGNDTTGNSGDQDYKALYEETLQKYEQARKDKNGLIAKYDKVKKSEPKTQTQTKSFDNSRLDRIELRQLDNSLTADEISDILTIKSAKGYEDVGDALKDPMVTAFLKETRANGEKKERIQNAIPSDNTKAPSSQPKTNPIKTSKDWLKDGIPDNNTDAVAGIFSDMLAGE